MRGDLLAPIGVALLAAACSTARTEPAERTWPAWLSPCVVTGLEGDARCGTVSVAESPQAPDGRRIAIRVVVVPARSPQPAADPMLLLAGGPGQGAADLAAAMAQRGDLLRDERDLVLIDQRGTGSSNGLQCSTRPAAALMGQIFEAAHLAACREELAARADLTRYTTSAAAEDYPIALDALGYRQVNVWGVSYGTRVGLELTRRYPDRVRTLLVEGVVPPSFTWPKHGAADFQAALDALVEDCAADASCARAFPRFRDEIATAFARLKARRVTVEVYDPATRRTEHVLFGVTDLAYSTRGLLYGNESLALPQLFHDAAQGRYEGFAQAYVTRARTLERQIARGVHLGVYCAEDLPFVNWSRAYERASDTLMATYLIDQYHGACDVWPGASIPASFREPVTTSVPVLAMAGRRDPVTPPRTAEAIAKTLPRSRALIWRNGAHGTDGLVSPNCRAGIIREFVASADPHALDVSCMSRDPALPFRVP